MLLSYEKFKELEDSYNREFDSEEQKELFNIIQNLNIKINILDQDYVKYEKYGFVKIKYHVALTCNMNTLIINFESPEDLYIDNLLYDLVCNWYETIDKNEEEIIDMLISDYGIDDAKNFIKAQKYYKELIKFMNNSKLNLEELKNFFEKIEY